VPRDGAIIFSDLIGKLDVLRLDELTAECPKKTAHNMNDRCGARCQDLPKVL
jgi:hypothetical protein